MNIRVTLADRRQIFQVVSDRVQSIRVMLAPRRDSININRLPIGPNFPLVDKP